MTQRKKKIPVWYVDGDLQKTIDFVFNLIEKGYNNEKIALEVNKLNPGVKPVSGQAMQAFLGKRIRKELLEFLDSLPEDHPAVKKRRGRVSWLINKSRKETNLFIQGCIDSGWKRKEMVEAINDMVDGKVDEASLNNYISTHIDNNGKKPIYCPKLAKENRFFSVHIMGAKPEALDRWRLRCTA